MKKSLNLIKFLGAGFLSLGAISISAAAINHTYKSNTDKADAAINYSDADNYHAAGNAWSLFTTLQSLTYTTTTFSYTEVWTTYGKIYYTDSAKHIKDYYSNTSNFVYSTNQCGNYKVEGDCYNREHSIPKSWWGSGDSAKTKQGADPIIVIPTDGKINSYRSNYPLGVVDTSKSYSYSNNEYSKWGDGSSTYGYTSDVFEPNDDIKGDLARIVFYACVRYSSRTSNYVSYPTYNWRQETPGQSTFNGIEPTQSNNGADFCLTDYAIKLFTKWHNDDKPDDWERTINERFYNVQSNKNPFIDRPEYVNTLWGSNSNATEYTDDPTPSTDPTISINPTSLTLTEGGSTGTITATISNGSGDVTWTSSDTDVVTVSGSGTNKTTCTVTPGEAGTATITASYSTATPVTCSVTVNSSGGGGDDPEVESEILDFTAQGYSNEQVVESLSATYSSVSLDKGTNNNAPKYYTSGTAVRCYGGNTFTISSTSKTIKRIELTFGSSDGSNAITTNVGTYSSGTWTGSASSITFTIGGTSGNRRIQKITVYYESATPTPSEKVLSSIALSGTYSTTFTQGDSFSHTGMVVTASYTDSTTYPDTDVSDSENLEFTGYDMSTTGQQTVTVTYTENNVEKSQTYTITVNAAPSPSDPQEGTGTINFGNGTGDVNVNSASVTGDDSLSNTWTITTEGTTSFTPNANYSQIGSSSKPATSITFTTTLSATMKIIAFSCKFGGFNGTAGTITMKVGDTTVATGSLNTTSDVTVTATTVQNTFPRMGTSLTITVTGISKGVKAYYISYTCQTWATNFLSLVTCNNGVTPPNSTNWKQTNTDYSALTQSEKNDVLAANPNQLGTKLEQAIARYVEVVNKYPNRTNYPDYLNKAVTSNRAFTPISNTSGLTMILLMLSITSTMVGFIFVGYYLKKKER